MVRSGSLPGAFCTAPCSSTRFNTFSCSSRGKGVPPSRARGCWIAARAKQWGRKRLHFELPGIAWAACGGGAAGTVHGLNCLASAWHVFRVAL